MARERSRDGSRGIFLAAAILGILFPCYPSLSNEGKALLEFKKSIADDPLSRLSGWSEVESDPCSWLGVSCWPDHGNVTALNLPNSSLSGFLPQALGLLTSLQTLNLSGNRFLGTIPKEIGKLSHLNVLDLSNNQLMGAIPNEVGNLTSITRISLQHNQVTGSLPAELGTLKNLVELRLNRNMLEGPLSGNYSPGNSTASRNGPYGTANNVIGLCRATQLKVADFSDNYFSGRIPSCLKSLVRSSFKRNCFLDRDYVIQRSSQQGNAIKDLKGHEGNARKVIPKTTSSRPAWLLAVEVITGVVAGSLLMYLAGAAFCRYKGTQKVTFSWKQTSSGLKVKELPTDYEIVKGVRKLSRQDLEVACEEFSNIIVSSPDSVVYKGTIKGGPEIAVISLCISDDYWTNYLDVYFQIEVADLARLNHNNTAKLVGYCSENDPFSRMLVFEYASNGTLYEHLHDGEECQLSWAKRMKIVVGVARGLRYMHCELKPAFALSELNSSAVYLTEEFSPKLVDFESWKAILARSEKNSGYVNNYSGYSAEFFRRFSSDIKGNVSDFGVLLLELISGRPPFCKEEGCLIDWARKYLDLLEAIAQQVDPRLKQFRHEDVRVICEVVNLCIHPDPTKRPPMTILCSMLENGIDTSPTASLKESHLAWAELALSS